MRKQKVQRNIAIFRKDVLQIIYILKIESF